MKSPLWILNSSLLFLFPVIFFLFFAFKPEMPARTSLTFKMTPLEQPEGGSINLARIYENDLFNTFIKPTEPPVIEKIIPSLPPAPMHVPPQPIQTFKPQFLSPLDVTLKGIMYSQNDNDKQVIIANNKTQQEGLYKLGDKIDDAELISIGKNKITLVRSNGQQETIFITPDDAQKDPIYGQLKPWTNVIKKLSETEYSIDPHAFIKRINSLAHFIDMLDLTTAFEQGRTLGCKVGKMTSKSIGPALGLRFGDIITAVNDIPTLTSQERAHIFELLTHLPLNSTIKVDIIRYNQMKTLMYTLQKIESEEEKEQQVLGSPFQVPSEINNKSSSFSPNNDMNMLMREMKRKDQQTMLQQGGQDAFLSRAS